MAVRPTMASIITQTRLLTNDLAGPAQIFADQDYQDVLDKAPRTDMRYLILAPSPTYAGSTISYFDYYSDLTDWEDDLILSQWRITTVTPSVSENVAGHWTFALSTLPPLYIIGKTYDIYRAAADMLERLAARWMLSYNITVDGQGLQRSQAIANIQAAAKSMRKLQRARVVGLTRGDLVSNGGNESVGLGPIPVDFYGSGNGR